MRKKKYPAQKRYEEKNPAITFRVTLDEYSKIKQMADQSGRSISQLVRIALLGLEQDFSSAYENAKRIGNSSSYNTGYAEAKKKYSVWVTCFNCKNPIEVLPESDIHYYIIDVTRG